ncbi:MAG: transcriptional regulator, LuxR family [Marmoricola sp.]|jgi:DNA-binding CsgD family transcriptional regulator|nr:transcriptional regulator, LuxR family [Marmoricola sp.]
MTAACGRLEDGNVYSSFLWPRGGAHAPDGHVQVTALAAPAGLPAVLSGVVLLSPVADLHELTPRELEVLALINDGCSNQEIARALFVAPRTVAAHIEHLLFKLDATSRTSAAVRAEREGLYIPTVGWPGGVPLRRAAAGATNPGRVQPLGTVGPRSAPRLDRPRPSSAAGHGSPHSERRSLRPGASLLREPWLGAPAEEPVPVSGSSGWRPETPADARSHRRSPKAHAVPEGASGCSPFTIHGRESFRSPDLRGRSPIHGRSSARSPRPRRPARRGRAAVPSRCRATSPSNYGSRSQWRAGPRRPVVAVGGLAAVVARLGRSQALPDDLRRVNPHRLRTAQLSRGPLAPPQVEPSAERSRARAVDPDIDLGGVGHDPRLGTSRWPTRQRPAGGS